MTVKNHFSEFCPQDGGESELALKLRHCHRMEWEPDIWPTECFYLALEALDTCQSTAAAKVSIIIIIIIIIVDIFKVA